MKLLHIDSSILGEGSASRALTREIVDRFRRHVRTPRSLTSTWPPRGCRIFPNVRSPRRTSATPHAMSRRSRSSSPPTSSCSARPCTTSRSRPSSRRGSTGSRSAGKDLPLRTEWTRGARRRQAGDRRHRARRHLSGGRRRPSSASRTSRHLFGFLGVRDLTFVRAEGTEDLARASRGSARGGAGCNPAGRRRSRRRERALDFSLCEPHFGLFWRCHECY